MWDLADVAGTVLLCKSDIHSAFGYGNLVVLVSICLFASSQFEVNSEKEV